MQGEYSYSLLSFVLSALSSSLNPLLLSSKMQFYNYSLAY